MYTIVTYSGELFGEVQGIHDGSADVGFYILQPGCSGNRAQLFRPSLSKYCISNCEYVLWTRTGVSYIMRNVQY